MNSPDAAQIRRQLRLLLTENFDLEELRTLAFDLGVDFDNLRGEGKEAKARELVAHLERSDRLGELLEIIGDARPRIEPCLPHIPHKIQPSSKHLPQRPPRIVHSLLPAPDFQHRPQLDIVRKWWKDESQRGILALVGVGGAGKTAIVHRFLAELPCTPYLPDWPKQMDLPTPVALFVWSFYDSPDAEDFFTELFGYLTDQAYGSAPRKATLFQVIRVLEQIDGRVLLVLDGLESMQEGTKENTFGMLRDVPMRQFVRRLADGIGEVRALITTRFPMTDLINYRCAWYRSENVDLLDTETAKALLRTRGVRGSDEELNALIAEFGAHAQTLDHLATLLAKFCEGNPARIHDLPPLEQVMGDAESGLQARRLGRIFRFYEQQLPSEQLAILQRLAVFHKSVNLSTLSGVILRSLQESQDPVASNLTDYGLREALYRLRDLHLVYVERMADGSELVVIHPMIRNHFYHSLGSKVTHISESIRKPLFWHVLDLEEELLHQSLQAGRMQEAFDIFWHRMGSWDYLGLMLGAYARGEAILRSFVGSDDPSLIPPGLTKEDQRKFINARGLFLMALGRLNDAVICFERRFQLAQQEHLAAAAALCNKTNVLVKLGRLKEARTTAAEAMTRSEKVTVGSRYRTALSWYSYISGLTGEVEEALQGFQRFWELLIAARGEEAPISKIESIHEAEILLRLGELEKAASIARASREACKQENELLRLAHANLVLAEIARLQGDFQKARELLEQTLGWGMETAAQEILVKGYLLQARMVLQADDCDAAESLLKRGLNIAEEYSYGLYWIDLKIAEGLWHLHYGDVLAAEDCARTALAGKQETNISLFGAQSPECSYAWGEGDALHLLGQSLLTQKRKKEAYEALAQALNIRLRIRDPKAEQSHHLLQVARRGGEA